MVPRFFASMVVLLAMPAMAGLQLVEGSGFAVPGAKFAGLAMADVNRDGCVDVVVNTFDRTVNTHLFLQDCSATSPPRYVDVTSAWCPPLLSVDTERAVAWGDFDGDGWPDLVRSTSLLVELRRGLDGGALADPPTVRLDAGPGGLSDLNAEGIGVLDYDGDGRLDLMVQSNGIAMFRNVSDASGVTLRRVNELGLPVNGADNGEFTAVGDVDVDGWPDIVARLEALPALWLNQQGQRFEASASFTATSDIGPAGQMKGAVLLADFDGDGRFDIFWSSVVAAKSEVWLQTAPRQFVRTGQPGGFGLINGAAAGDVDHDGRVDLVVTTESAGTQLFLNRFDAGVLAFEGAMLAGSDGGGGYGAVLVDDDRDGDLDLLVNAAPTTQRYVNDVNDGRSLVVRVTRGARDELGATLHLEGCDGSRRSAEFEISGGGGRGSQNEPVAHVGLPFGREQPVVVAVKHVGGRVTRVAVVPAQLTSRVLSVDFDQASNESACAAPMARFTSAVPDGAACGVGWAYQPVVDGLPAGASFSITARDGTELPGGMRCDPTTGRVEWTPLRAQPGPFSLELVASVGGAVVARQSLDLVVDCPGRLAHVGCGCSASEPGWVVVLIALARWRRRSGVSLALFR